MNNLDGTPLTRQNIVDAIDALRARAAEPFAILSIEPPAISPRFLSDLIERGYVEGDKWTPAGLAWLYGIPVADGTNE